MKNRRILSRSLQLAALALLPIVGCDQSTNTGTPDMQTAQPDLAPTSRFGLVRVTGTTSGSSAIATFLDMQQAGAGCLHRALGECVLYTCAGSSFVQPNAGSLTITGGTQPITLPVRNDGSYNPYDNTSMVTFSAGQKLTLDLPGATVPAIHTELTPPNVAFSLTSPDGSRPSIVFNLNRLRDYHVMWTALSAGMRVHAELNQSTDSNHGMIIDCDFDGTSGDGVIPTGLLSGFQLTDSGSLTPVGTFFVGPSTNLSLKPSGWDVSVYGMANGRRGSANITEN